MTKYSDKATQVKQALDAVYENKRVNKKDDISGDYSSDTASYPTVKAVKGALAGKSNTGHGHTVSDISDFPDIPSVSGKEDASNKVTSWSGTVTDTHYPSEKLVKDSLDGKAASSHTHTKSQITDFPEIPDVSGKIDTAGTGLSKSGTTLNHSNSIDAQTTNQFKKFKFDGQGHITGVANVEGSDLPSHSHSEYGVTVAEITTESGYLKSYAVKQNNAQVGATINIPKDYLVKSAELKTCTVADQPVSGYKVGDKYLDFIINTKDSQTSTGDQHLYILVSDLIDTYNADGTTISLNSSTNTFSVNSTKAAYWDGKSDLSTNDVDTEVEAYLDALVNAINPPSSS